MTKSHISLIINYLDCKKKSIFIMHYLDLIIYFSKYYLIEYNNLPVKFILDWKILLDNN